jgi:hypothetical protein
VVPGVSRVAILWDGLTHPETRALHLQEVQAA